MKIYFITGCAGFIGFHLAQKLLSDRNIVVGIDNLSAYYDTNLKRKRLKILQENTSNFYFYEKDIQDKNISEIFKTYPPTKVIHLAAQAGVRYSMENPYIYGESNLIGFLNILEECKKKDVPIIYASSSSVYGEKTADSFSEDMPTDCPISLYAATKKANELMAYSYSTNYSLNTLGLRFFTVYGPWGRPDMALFNFTKKILNDEIIAVYNNGDMYRDFTYIDDIISGIYAAISFTQKNPYEIFNLGCGNPRKLIDFIKEIELCCGKKANIDYQPLQKGDVLRTSANISKAQKLLNFNPQINIEEGIYNFVKWYTTYYS